MGKWIQEIFDGDVYDTGKGHDFNQVIAPSNRLSSTEVENINMTLEDNNQNHDKTFRWTNNIQLVAGKYQFNYTTDDGMRFYINNTLVAPASPSTDSWHTQGPTDYVAYYTVPTDGIYNIRVEYFNHKGGGIAHFWWILVEPAVQPQPPVQTVPPPITQFVPSAQPPTNLLDVVQASKQVTSRTYVKGTLTPIAEDSFVVTNTSDTLTVAVNIASIGGVKFSPVNFNLAPKQVQTVTVSFDPRSFETLSEGINEITSIINISAVSMVQPAVTPEVIPVSIPPLILEQPPTSIAANSAITQALQNGAVTYQPTQAELANAQSWATANGFGTVLTPWALVVSAGSFTVPTTGGTGSIGFGFGRGQFANFPTPGGTVSSATAPATTTTTPTIVPVVTPVITTTATPTEAKPLVSSSVAPVTTITIPTIAPTVVPSSTGGLTSILAAKLARLKQLG